MKGRRKKTKYSMVFATMVAMLSVCTAGVSTFAWFQASSEVRVSAASSSTTITVADPNETTYAGLYVYQDNYTNSGGGSSLDKRTINGVFPSARSNLGSSIDFDGEGGAETNFKHLVSRGRNDGDLSFYTASSSFLPGQRISFAILVDGDAEKARTLSISGCTSPDPNDNRYVHTGSAKTTTKIKLAAAINVYATLIPGTFNTSTHVFTSSSDTTTGATISKFLKSNTDKDDNPLDDKFDYAPGGSLTDSYPLIELEDSVAAQDTLFLYTIEFGNSGTALYQHAKNQTSFEPEYVSPSFANSTTSYWKQDGTYGSSEVFQGLRFNISSLLIM